MTTIYFPGIGDVGVIKNMTNEMIAKMAQGLISGAILDKAEEVEYTLRVDGEKRIKKAKLDGEWARLTTDRYARNVLNQPNTRVSLDRSFFSGTYFRQLSEDGGTEAYCKIIRWKENEGKGPQAPTQLPESET